MAKNTWKYASLTQRERLKRIRNGDMDVYNAEISNNEKLKKVRAEAGLDTSDVDLWNTAITRAKHEYDRANSKYKVKRTANTPVFDGKEVMASEFVRNKTAQSLADKALDDAEKAILSLKEYYANRGLSTDSPTYNDQIEVISKALSDELYKIAKDYKTKYDSRINSRKKNLFE